MPVPRTAPDTGPPDLGPRPPPVVVASRHEDGAERPFLLWRFPSPWCAVSSAPVGGGWGPCAWILNVQVRPGYDRIDLDVHLAEVATGAGLTPGLGVGLLTAADVTAGFDAADDGVQVRATVGIRWPTWAAAPPEPPGEVPTSAPGAVGTINLVVLVPAPVAPAALVNLATTATEAKAQALVQAGVAGTGTASDAVVVACPLAPGHPDDPDGAGRGAIDAIDERGRFGGPRSPWGAATARAVHRAVTDGVHHSRRVMAAEDADGAGEATR